MAEADRTIPTRSTDRLRDGDTVQMWGEVVNGEIVVTRVSLLRPHHKVGDRVQWTDNGGLSQHGIIIAMHDGALWVDSPYVGMHTISDRDASRHSATEI